MQMNSRKILELSKNATKDEIEHQCKLMVDLNKVDASGVGSPYLQEKISNASVILVSEVLKANPESNAFQAGAGAK